VFVAGFERKADVMRVERLLFVVFLAISGFALVPLFAQTDSSGGGSSAFTTGEKADFPEGAVALIGGKPLSLDEVRELTYERHGYNVLIGLIHTKIVRAEAAKQKTSVTKKEIEKRYIDEISAFSSNANVQEPLAAFQRYLGSTFGMTIDAYKHMLETQIMIRKLAEADKAYQEPKVDEREVEYAFMSLYGPRYTMQLIFTKEKGNVEKARKELDDGADFGDVSAKYASNEALKAARGFLGQGVGEPELEAMLGKENVSRIKKLEIGQHTEPFFQRTGWNIVKLVHRIPAARKEMDKETEEELRDRLYREKSRNLVQSYLSRLTQTYKVKVNKDLLPESRKE
jgi:hypothetical protein